MTYERVRPNVDGTLPVRRSISSGAPVEILPGELAVNAADGVVYVGLNTGKVSTLPKASGFNAITSLTQTEYDALVGATATISTVLYVVTPDPEEPEEE